MSPIIPDFIPLSDTSVAITRLIVSRVFTAISMNGHGWTGQGLSIPPSLHRLDTKTRGRERGDHLIRQQRAEILKSYLTKERIERGASSQAQPLPPSVSQCIETLLFLNMKSFWIFCFKNVPVVDIFLQKPREHGSF